MLLKVNCFDEIDSESAFEGCEYLCRQLSACGIDGIEISGQGDVPGYTESIYRDYAVKIAKSAEVPIILVGKNRTPDVMTQILNATGIGYFALSRPLIRQPDLINLWEKDLGEVPTCISCGKCMQATGTSCVFE